MAVPLPDSRPLELQRFPIGKFIAPGVITATDLQDYMAAIAALPAQMWQAVQGLSDNQLDTPYRAGGWTLRQVVHHVADSHLNSYIRFRLALTEDAPTIKPYEEALWAELPDARAEPVEVSLKLLESLHHRWVVLLNSLTAPEWQKIFIHPVSGNTTLAKAAGLYAWHGRHHLAHLLSLREINKW